MLSRYLPIFIILSIIAEIFGTIGGFGSSVFFVPIANFFLDFQSVLGITALFHLSSNVTKIALFKKGLDRKLLKNLGLPAIVFVSLGAYISRFLDPKILNYLLAAFLISMSLILLIFKNLIILPSFKNAVIGGALSGFSAGILGTGGAIRGLTMASFRLNKDKFIATSAVIDLGVDFSRTIIYYFNGYIHKHDMYLIPILILVAILGTYIGKLVLDRITQDQFKHIVLYLILGIGIASLFAE